MFALSISAAADNANAVQTSPQVEVAVETETTTVDTDGLASSIVAIISNAVTNWLANVVNSVFELIDSLLVKLLDTIFFAEDLVSSTGSTVLTAAMLNNVYGFLYAVSCSLVAFKFIRKGFNIYILWRDGDADSSPADMLKGVGEAVVYMIAFPFLYEKCVDIVKYLASGIMGRLGVAVGAGSITSIGADFILMGANFAISGLFFLAFFVMVFILWIMMMKQGFELLVMRIGFPLATQGLIDSDKALFKNYLQVFWKVALTAVIQVSLMSLAFRVIATMQVLNLFAAIAIIATAIGTPKLLQQFLVPQGGAGGLQKAQSVAMIARTAQMLFK